MMQSQNRDFERFFEGATFPCSKTQLMHWLHSKNAPQDVCMMFEQMPDRTFKNISEVSQFMGSFHGQSAGSLSGGSGFGSQTSHGQFAGTTTGRSSNQGENYSGVLGQQTQGQFGTPDTPTDKTQWNQQGHDTPGQDLGNTQGGDRLH